MSGREVVKVADFFGEDFAVQTKDPTAADGSWTAQLAVPLDAAGPAFVAGFCYDLATGTTIDYWASDDFRITPVPVPVQIQPPVHRLTDTQPP